MAAFLRNHRFRSALGIGGTVLCCVLGALAGIGSYTFYYAEGGSYLSDDPLTCTNCHVMQSHYDAWVKSSHRNVATCNDCHSPQDNLLAKYYCKGRNGFFHSLAFTSGDFPDQIMIHDYNRNVTENACRRCHSAIVHNIDNPPDYRDAEQMSCIRCHNEVGHPR